MRISIKDQGYRYEDAAQSCAHLYLLPLVRSELSVFFAGNADRRVFDLGCGNGSVAAWLDLDAYAVTGVDPSAEGLSHARTAYPHLNLNLGSAYDDLVTEYGQFPAVISLEVVEHVYAPRDFARTLYHLVQPGGLALVSTPYHGYLKNVALAVSGKLDRHFTALWDHGHIKFWSVRTLGMLLTEAGFTDLRFVRTGRVPVMAKSLVAVARKAADLKPHTAL